MPVYAGATQQQQQQFNGPMMPDAAAGYRGGHYSYQSPGVATVYPQHGVPPPPPPPLPDTSQYAMAPVNQPGPPPDISGTTHQFTADPRQVIL